MVITHAASAFWHHFHPWITKNMDLETVSHVDTPNQPKSQKGAQSGTQETPQMTLKSIKMDIWTSRCLLGVPVDPWITKMVT